MLQGVNLICFVDTAWKDVQCYSQTGEIMKSTTGNRMTFKCARFEVFTAVKIYFMVFWAVTLCTDYTLNILV